MSFTRLCAAIDTMSANNTTFAENEPVKISYLTATCSLVRSAAGGQPASCNGGRRLRHLQPQLLQATHH